jgi:hypothetical protein
VGGMEESDVRQARANKFEEKRQKKNNIGIVKK